MNQKFTTLVRPPLATVLHNYYTTNLALGAVSVLYSLCIIIAASGGYNCLSYNYASYCVLVPILSKLCMCTYMHTTY